MVFYRFASEVECHGGYDLTGIPGCTVRTTPQSSYSQLGFQVSKLSSETPSFEWSTELSRPKFAEFGDFGFIKDKNCLEMVENEWNYITLDDFITYGIQPLDGLEFDLKLSLTAGGIHEWCFDRVFLQQTIFVGDEHIFYYNSDQEVPSCLSLDSEMSSLELQWHVDCPPPSALKTESVIFTQCGIVLAGFRTK